MKSHTRVVVIGGGVVGCSVLYHLTKFGWTDVVLLERSELTSGSTWHAAGGMHTINGDPNKLQKYTVELYKEIEEYSGQDIGLHMTSGLMLAATNERFDWMKSLLAKGKYANGEATLISAEEAHEMMPLLDPKQFVGAVFDRLHVVVRQAEMMADFVDQNMGDDVAQRFLVLGPVVEDRAAIEQDPVRHVAAFDRETLRQAAAFEETQQVEGRFQRHVLENVVVGKLGQLDDQVAGQHAEFLRQMAESLLCQRFHCFHGGRVAVSPVVRPVDIGHECPF